MLYLINYNYKDVPSVKSFNMMDLDVKYLNEADDGTKLKSPPYMILIFFTFPSLVTYNNSFLSFSRY